MTAVLERVRSLRGRSLIVAPVSRRWFRLSTWGKAIVVLAVLVFAVALPQAIDPYWQSVLFYPVGLFIDGLGLAVANDAYAAPAVWEMFERDLYHSPRVVWGREISVLLAALAQGGRNRPGAIDSVRSAVARSGLQYAELWSYKFEGGVLRPVRYGSSSDVQLWSLTEIAVQYLLHSSRSTP